MISVLKTYMYTYITVLFRIQLNITTLLMCAAAKRNNWEHESVHLNSLKLKECSHQSYPLGGHEAERRKSTQCFQLDGTGPLLSFSFSGLKLHNSRVFRIELLHLHTWHQIYAVLLPWSIHETSPWEHLNFIK